MNESHRIQLLEQQVLMLNKDVAAIAAEATKTMSEMAEAIEGILKVLRMYQQGVEGRLEALEKQE